MIAELLVVRLIWGFTDTTHARFVNFEEIHLRPGRVTGRKRGVNLTLLRNNRIGWYF